MAIKRPKKAKIVPTEMQKRAAVAILENPRNKGKALLEAGYSKNTAIHPKEVLESEGYKAAAEPIIKQLEKLRQKAIERALETASEAGHSDVTRTIDLTTKNIQLLGGGATERVENRIDGIEYITPSEDK